MAHHRLNEQRPVVHPSPEHCLDGLQQGVGSSCKRKPIPRREAIYGIVTKVYSLCSGRRAEPDIKITVDRARDREVRDGDPSPTASHA